MVGEGFEGMVGGVEKLLGLIHGFRSHNLVPELLK